MFKKIDNLLMLKKHGFNVPRFIVVFSESDKSIDGLDKNKKYAVRTVSCLEDQINCSYAGVFKTELNVPFLKLKETIKRLKDSQGDFFNIYTANQETINGLQFIVQEMIDGDYSGTAFSINPYTYKNEIVIEAVYGLNEGLTSGKISPDIVLVQERSVEYNLKPQFVKYVCDARQGLQKIPVEIMDQSRHILSEEMIETIIKVMEQIKSIFITPFEIEWTVKNKQLYILQVRNITKVNKG